MTRHHDHQKNHNAGVAELVLPDNPRPTDDEIRERAYRKFCQRGDKPGDAVTDWLEAERDLFAERARIHARSLK